MPSPVELLMAIERFITACDSTNEDLNEDLWDAYEQARALLGDPVKMFPGGCENSHYHPYGWKTDDYCDACNDDQESKL